MAIEKAEDVKKVLNEVVNRMNEDRRRIRLIEQNIDRIESSVSSLESNVLTQMGDIKLTLDKINNRLSEVSTKMDAVETEILKFRKLIGKAATKVELKQLESFIDLVSPITSKFVTKDELERAFERRLKKKAKI